MKAAAAACRIQIVEKEEITSYTAENWFKIFNYFDLCI